MFTTFLVLHAYPHLFTKFGNPSGRIVLRIAISIGDLSATKPAPSIEQVWHNIDFDGFPTVKS